MRPGNRCWLAADWRGGHLVRRITGSRPPTSDVALVGFAFGIWHYVALSWLLLAYPTGRLAGRRERAVLALAAGLAAIRTLSRLFLYVPPDGTGCGCVTDRFAPVTDPRWYSAVDSAFPWVLVAVLVLVLGCALARWRRSSRAGRRMVTPVLLAGAALVTQVAYDYVIRQRTGLAAPSRTALFMLVVALRVATAAAFVAGLREQRAARSAVVDLVGSLDDRDTAPDRLGAQRCGARSGIPASSCWWRGRPPERAYVGTTGQHLVLPVAEPGRAVTLVEQDGAPVAALVHDEALLEDPGLVSAVAAAVRLTSDNERLRREAATPARRGRRVPVPHRRGG